MKARLILAIVVLLLCTTAWGAAPATHQYILVKNLALRQQPHTIAAAPLAAEVARVGGHVDYEGWDRLIVTLPDDAVDAISRHFGTKYLQLVRSGGTEVSTASVSSSAIVTTSPEPSPGSTQATSRSLRPIATTTSTWDSGTYAYDGAGNITGIGTDTFTYDSLSRLSTSSIKGNTESYVIDPYGNLIQKTTTATGGPPLVIDLTPSPLNNNHLAAQAYDTAGNLTGDSFETNTFDSFNMMRQKVLTNGAEYYLYNASDERIAVISNPCSIAAPPQNLPQNCSTALVTVSGRDEGGKVLRQMNLPYQQFSTGPWLWLEDYVYRDGQLLAAERPSFEGGRRHFHLDHLGSPRLVTGPAGQQIALHDYYPFGVEITSIHQETQAGFDREEPMKFTGHERDFNSGTLTENSSYNDYMQARSTSAGWGRFLSVDPKVDIEQNLPESQRWNRYAYVTNNPLRYIDPDGRERLQAYHFHRQPVPYRGLVGELTTVAKPAAFIAALVFGPEIAAAAVTAFLANPPGVTNAIGNALTPGPGGDMPGVPNPISGDFERVISTKAGDVSVLANASTKGTVLTLSDLTIYGTDKTIKAGEAGAGAFKAAVTSLAAEAKAQGYTEIVLQGLRYSGATQDTDKAARDILINLVERAK